MVLSNSNSRPPCTEYIYLIHLIHYTILISKLQNTLGTNNITRTNITRNPTLTGRANSNSKRLERTLRAVVVIITISATNMQRHARCLRKALQTMRDHLRAQVADLLAPEAKVDNRPRPTGEVNDRPRERLVERRVAAAESLEGLSCAECCCEGFA